MRFWWLVLVLAAVIVLAACGPRDRPPPPADTTIVVDSVLSDSGVVDSAAPADTAEEFGDDGTVPMADTLLPPRARGLLRVASAPAGLRVGLSTYLPTKEWGSGFLGATTLAGVPSSIGPLLRLAAATGMSLGFSLPRPLMTENGQRRGRFSLPKAKGTIDAIARFMPPDSLKKYTENRTLNYFTLMDDPGCLPCWGGRAVTAAEIAELAAYAQEKIGEAPIGLRVAPEWMVSHGGWNGNVDMAIVQWHTRKRQAQEEWYQRQRDLMPRLGLAKLVYAINADDCDGPNSDACSPEQLLRYGTVAIDQPGSCGFFSWRYNEREIRQTATREAWETLVARGRAKDPRTCAR